MDGLGLREVGLCLMAVACAASSPALAHANAGTRYATSVPPRTATTTFALPYSAVSDQFTNVSSTTWPNWTPAANVTVVPTQHSYGTAAYSNLWNALKPVNFTRGLYSTTVSPTPIPSSELVLPPPLVYNPRHAFCGFPKSFILAAAGSSAQCEGAVADEGRSPCLLDALYSLFAAIGGVPPSAGLGGSDSPPASDTGLSPDYSTNEHYYLYKQDIERLAAMGLKQYSFSIPMVRVLPFALPGTPVNTKALQHYSDVVDFILEKGMEPIVTLFYWETPLQFYGGGGFDSFLFSLASAQTNFTYGLVPGFSFGFQNATFQDAYVRYAEIVLAHLADRVPKWVTFNEPQVGATNGAAVYHVLKAHARVVEFYRNTLKGKGQISMKMATSPGLPRDPTNSSDVTAAQMYNDIYLGPWLNPLVLGEDYPQTFKTAVPDYIALTSADLAAMKDTLDYVSVDVYAPVYLSQVVSDFAQCAKNTSSSNVRRTYLICLGSSSTNPTGWAYGWSDGSPVYITPNTLRQQLRYLYHTYSKPLMVSETGFSTPQPSTLRQNLFNYPQSIFLLNNLDEILGAIHEDGIEITGMIIWNWGDDLEFTAFDNGFGLLYINHTTQERRYRRSFFDVVDFVESRRKEV